MPLSTLPPELLRTIFDATQGRLEGGRQTVRKLSDLRGCFANTVAFQTALAAGDPVLYSVTAVEPAGGPGDLHYGLGVLQPGRIGAEYYFTKGHLHAWREAAEVYLCLRGAGGLLLEEENGGAARLVDFSAGSVVYVPGHCAHRTINWGVEPLIYFGIYPAGAGHDYESIARRNFRHVVVDVEGRPTLRPRHGET